MAHSVQPERVVQLAVALQAAQDKVVAVVQVAKAVVDAVQELAVIVVPVAAVPSANLVSSSKRFWSLPASLV